MFRGVNGVETHGRLAQKDARVDPTGASAASVLKSLRLKENSSIFLAYALRL